MKKQLNDLLKVTGKDKHLNINDYFRVSSMAVSEYGEPIAIFSEAKPHHNVLKLEFLNPYGKSIVLTSADPEALNVEIAEGMKRIMSEITDKMVSNWANGYITGQVTEE